MVYNSVLSDTDVANLSDWAIQRYALELGNVPAFPKWTGGTGKRYLHVFHHTTDETLWFGESDDGIHIVNAGEANLSGYYPPGDFAFGGLRDPSYHREGNYHYLAVSNISIEHRPESFRAEHFTILRSSDLVNWSTYGTVDLSNVFKTPGNNNVWAPQWFQDSDGKLYVIVSTSDDDASSFRIRAVPITSLDPLVYGDSIELNYPGTGYIDASIQKIGSTYRMWVGPGQATYMESASLFGPYSAPRSRAGSARKAHPRCTWATRIASTSTWRATARHTSRQRMVVRRFRSSGRWIAGIGWDRETSSTRGRPR